MNNKTRLTWNYNMAKARLYNSAKKPVPKDDVMETISPKSRDGIAREESRTLANHINLPHTPLTCSGTAYKCNVAGSGKTQMVNVPTRPQVYDFLATPLKEGGLTGNTFRLPIVHNWANSGIESDYTKHSLKATYGFENFQ